MTTLEDLPAIFDELEALYADAVATLRHALSAYLKSGVRPDVQARAAGAFAYPELRVHYAPDGPAPRVPRAFARMNTPGTYATSVTRPAMFRAYLMEQLRLLVRD